MPAKLLTGKEVAAALYAGAAETVAELSRKSVVPTLAILRAGERPDDVAYEKSIEKQCKSAGVAVKSVYLPDSAGQSDLMASVGALNRDGAVHGVLIFRPLPGQFDEKAVSAALCPEKDVDGITPASLAAVFAGSGAGFAPCTARACVEILDFYGISCEGRRAAVVGRSLVVGKPAAMLLLARNATVTLCHTKTRDLPSAVREAEIVIAAAGKAGAITGEHLSPGQVVIDVGINVSAGGRLRGDVAFDEAERVVSAITPVPGGVGGVTTAVLISNAIAAARRQTINTARRQTCS